MKLLFHSFIDKGNYSQERIALRVSDDCNIKFFLILLTEKVTDQFFNQPSKTFWFPPKDVKKGDWVVLYTKSGVASDQKNEDGSTTFFYYWGIPTPIYNRPIDGIVVAALENWDLQYNN
jgi:hypothetical protein